MNHKYSDWIAANVTQACGQCAGATQAMAAAFPELRRVRGHYHCFAWGEREHWWLVAPDNTIVDPTASQFPSRGQGEYVEWDESSEEPSGRCPNCGELIYDGGDVCSEKCGIEYATYCTNPFGR